MVSLGQIAHDCGIWVAFLPMEHIAFGDPAVPKFIRVGGISDLEYLSINFIGM
jgi:hypothetical protein